MTRIADNDVHELFYVVVDPRTGDIFWTEDLSYRVMSLHDKKTFRIAGNGVRGLDQGFFVNSPLGARALNTSLAGPTNIVLHPNGGLVFIDGSAPGRILRFNATTGFLEPIWQPSKALASNVIADVQMVASSTASRLTGLAFQGAGERFALLVADTPQHSVIRRIDFGENTVKRYIGSLFGNASDSAPLRQAIFSSIVAITGLPGGGIAMADAGTNTLRVGINDNATFAICPAGYACSCGTPVPCVDAASFCPANKLQALRVASGFFAVSNAGKPPLYVNQQACPRGYFCEDGKQRPCPAGSYGKESLTTGPFDCVSCPIGTFNADTGATDVSACLPCPLGSFANASRSSQCTLCPRNTRLNAQGAKERSSCMACGDSQVSLPGSTSCVSLANASYFATGDIVTIVGVVP